MTGQPKTVPETAGDGGGGAGVPQKEERQILRGGTAGNDRTAKPVPQNSRSIPQKNDRTAKPVPQSNDDENIGDDDLDDDDFTDYDGDAGWRTEQRFYTKKDGTVMLYWNYRSRNPVYINGERTIPYKPGGKKIWQRPPKRKKKSTK